jgi:glycosidase
MKKLALSLIALVSLLALFSMALASGPQQGDDFPATPTPMPEQTTPVTTGTNGLPWWNDQIFYEVFVRSFYDGSGDGIGDIQGLIEKLDYLNDGDPTTTSDLGVTGLWLMPVAQSPSYHGYDVTDYEQIEQDYGTNEDFQQLIEEAHARGMVVIVDLVMNHTSSEHPWFLDAREHGEHEDWYIWSDTDPGYNGPWGESVWHEIDGRYFYGVFWEGMPDLNYRNPAVTEAMYGIIRFWLDDMQVDGFRLDAIKHVIEEDQVQENTPETHDWLIGFHRFVRSVNPDALMVGEVMSSSSAVAPYVGNNVDIAFEFDFASAILQSANSGGNAQVAAVQNRLLDMYPEGQYATFITNHDQNRTMSQLRGNVGKAKIAATILLTSPGVPFIYYGEEIGMTGEKPDERIRTPMQWDDTDGTAGFTTGRPWEFLQTDYDTVNVADESSDPNSLLNHYRNLIHARADHSALRTGDYVFVDSDVREVYSFLRYDNYEAILVVINMSNAPVSAYSLTLESGPLASVTTATSLLDTRDLAAPTINANGGFEGYKPLGNLPPRGSLVIQLQ